MNKETKARLEREIEKAAKEHANGMFTQAFEDLTESHFKAGATTMGPKYAEAERDKILKLLKGEEADQFERNHYNKWECRPTADSWAEWLNKKLKEELGK